MAKFCGKCGSPLNEDGSCPKCNAAQNAGDNNEINKRETDGAVSNNSAPEKPVKLTHKEKKTAKKAEKKRRKKEKRAAMSFGQKTKRFFLKLLALMLALAILAGSVSCALVYFDIADIPFIEKVMGWFGYEKEEPEGFHFASIPGKFTDEKITNADEAIKAAQNAASQLGLQTATDELTLLKEDTVGELTYYRLQQNYQGIPVYGKTIVVVADKNGEAKSITSNAEDVKTVNINIDYNSIDYVSICTSFLNSNGLNNVTKVKVQNVSDVDLVLYTYENQKTCLAAFISFDFNYEFGESSVTVIVNLENKTVICYKPALHSDKVKCYAATQEQGSFNGLKLIDGEVATFYMKDVDRNIYIYDAQDQTFYKPPYGDDRTSLLNAGVPQQVTSPDEFFGNDSTNEEHYDRGYNLLKGLSFAYDYFNRLYSDAGIGTVIGVFDDHVGAYNGDNAGGGIVDITSVLGNDTLPDFNDPNLNNKYSGCAGLITFGTIRSSNFNSSMDTLFHEYTHFLTRKNVDWSDMDIEENQTGAINEAYSDIFGEIIESVYNNAEPNWQHGSRNMQNPKSNGYAETVNSKNNGGEDYTHGHSTVVSYAAYLMHADLKKGTSLSIAQLSDLWYNTMLVLPSNCTFSLLRQYMEITAETLNYTSSQKERISAAFDKVGIKSEKDNTEKYNRRLEFNVFDKNGLHYDDYTIIIDGTEFTGWFKLGWVKQDYHKEVIVTTSSNYYYTVPAGDYSVRIIDNFSGNKTYSKSIKARDNQDLKERIDFATAFGYDYNVNSNPELQVKDVNVALYDNYTATIKGENESGTAYSKTVTVDKPEAPALDLETGKYSFLLTDNADKSKTKSFSVRVRPDAPTSVIQIKTAFGKPYGEFDKSDLPPGVREFNGHYYYIYNMPEITTWEQAQEYCRSRNGYLATLTTREENSFAYSLLNSFNETGAYFGLRDAGYNDWQWVNNETFSYSNWAYGEPNSFHLLRLQFKYIY